jgi:hypothetical protein
MNPGVQGFGLLATRRALRLRREQHLTLGEHGGLDLTAELRMRLEGTLYPRHGARRKAVVGPK